MRRRCTCLAIAVACCTIASCDGRINALPEVAAKPSAVGQPRSTEVLVSAAASTQEVVEALAAEFSKRSGVNIKVNPGPSSGLANQIIQGAPAYLFLAANREWAAKVADAELAERSVELVTSKLVIIVPTGNPASVETPEDLLSDKVKKVALAGERVPAGMYSDQALAKLQLLEKLTAARKIARAQDVRGALHFVERGEAEAGIVYSTDAMLASNVEVAYELDPSLHGEIIYVLMLLKHGANNSDARSFFDYLQSEAAEEIYAQAGFLRIKRGPP